MTGDERSALQVTVHVPDPGDMAEQRQQPVATGADTELPCPPVPEKAPTVIVPLDDRVPGLKALLELASKGAEERTNKRLVGIVNRVTSRGGKDVQAQQVADSVMSEAEAEAVAALAERFRADTAKQRAQGLSPEEVRLVLPVRGSGPADLITGYRLAGLLAQVLEHRITVQTQAGAQIDVCP